MISGLQPKETKCVHVQTCMIGQVCSRLRVCALHVGRQRRYDLDIALPSGAHLSTRDVAGSPPRGKARPGVLWTRCQKQYSFPRIVRKLENFPHTRHQQFPIRRCRIAELTENSNFCVSDWL